MWAGPRAWGGQRGGAWCGGRSPESSWDNNPLPTAEACAVLGGDAERNRRKLPPVGGTATLSWPAQGDTCPPPRVMLPGDPLPGPGNLGLSMWLPAPTLNNPSSSKSFWTPSTAHASTSAPDGGRASSRSPQQPQPSEPFKHNLIFFLRLEASSSSPSLRIKVLASRLTSRGPCG